MSNKASPAYAHHQERTLDDEDAWREEAEAVIRDVREGVEFVEISSKLQVGKTQFKNCDDNCGRDNESMKTRAMIN